MIVLYSDVLFKSGGIETYLHALSSHLLRLHIPFRIAVAELERCSLLDELEGKGVSVYRQHRVWGDRWLVRQRCLNYWMVQSLNRGDWVFCVRQPMEELYLPLVRNIHKRGAMIASSWALAPIYLPAPSPSFCIAVSETDCVVSVSKCTTGQFSTVYDYKGLVNVVPYHNELFFNDVIPLPPPVPLRIGYIGRLHSRQKNVSILLRAFATIVRLQPGAELHLYGHGPDQHDLCESARALGIDKSVVFHGAYDHRRDLPGILGRCHFFVYPSIFEGGPCFTLLELMQAGRYCIASRVGGIPDLYESRPNLGRLVEPNDVVDLTQAILDTIQLLRTHQIDGHAIRNAYFDGFDVTHAHAAWLSALGLNRV
jgi:glycosyltransferase involved in cell wall biosynthesis